MKNLLLQAKHEIIELRRQNELLRAKVEVVEVFSAALLGVPRSQGMAPDVVWELQREIDRIDAQPVQPKMPDIDMGASQSR